MSAVSVTNLPPWTQFSLIFSPPWGQAESGPKSPNSRKKKRKKKEEKPPLLMTESSQTDSVFYRQFQSDRCLLHFSWTRWRSPPPRGSSPWLSSSAFTSRRPRSMTLRSSRSRRQPGRSCLMWEPWSRIPRSPRILGRSGPRELLCWSVSSKGMPGICGSYLQRGRRQCPLTPVSLWGSCSS